MPTALETLKTRKETIREELDQLKSLSQSQEKEQKQQKIATEISELDQELQTYLAQESDAAKKAEAQEVVKELATFFSALESLKQEVLEDQKSTSESKDEQSSSTAKAESAPEKKKNFLQKGMEWIKGDEKEVHHTAKAVGRGALVASGVGIAVYGLGKLFGRWGKKAEVPEKTPSSEKKEKKMSWRKKSLLWAGGVFGAGWLIKTLSDDPKDASEKASGTDTTSENGNSQLPEGNSDEADSGLSASSSEEAPEENSDVSSENEDKALSPEEQEATEMAQKMYSEGYMDWYILLKMYQMGFVPKFNTETWRGNGLKGKFRYLAEGGPFTKGLDKMSNFRADVLSYLKGSMVYGREEMLKMQTEAVAKGNVELAQQLDAKANLLAELHQDLEKGNIKSLKELEAHPKYKGQLDEFGKMKFSKLQGKVQLTFDETMGKLTSTELKTIETELKTLQQDAHKKLAELDQKVKADPKQKAKLQAEAKEIVKNYNKQCLEAEQKLGLKLSKATKAELLHFQKESGIVNRLMKVNNGVDNFVQKTKAGKFMVGAGVITLLVNGASGKTSRKQVGLEAADLGAGFVPFAGGAYDVWTSITGEGIAGELSTTDRWIRGVAGGASVVLDVVGVFTFGAGNAASAALKGAARGATATAKAGRLAKAGKVIKTTAEIASTGVKVAGFGFLGYSLLSEAVPLAVGLYEKIDKKMVDDISIQ